MAGSLGMKGARQRNDALKGRDDVVLKGRVEQRVEGRVDQRVEGAHQAKR